MNAPDPKSSPDKSELNAEFLAAIAADDLKRAAEALKKGADVDAVETSRTYDEWGGSSNPENSLHKAIEKADYRLAKWLLEHGADPNASHDAKTPLLRAVDKATYTGADQEKLDQKREGYRIARLLLESGADPNRMPQQSSYGYYHNQPLALHKAAAAGNEPLAQLLIRYGADVNLKVRDGSTPLWHAATNNRVRMSCILINAGADPVADNDNRYQGPRGGYGNYKTALHQFNHSYNVGSEAYAERIAVYKALLDAGADVLVKNSEGKTPYEVMDEIANDRGKEVAKLYKQYEEYPKFDPETISTLRRRNLFSVDLNGNTLLDSPSTWKHFREITEHLNSIGEPLRPEDLQARNKEGKSWLERGIECYALEDILSMAAPASEPGSISKLFGIKPRSFGEATWENTPPALRAVASRMHMDVLFSDEVWNGRTKDEIRAVYNALPVTVQEDVGNFQQLIIKLPNQRPTPGRSGSIGRYEIGGDFGFG